VTAKPTSCNIDLLPIISTNIFTPCMTRLLPMPPSPPMYMSFWFPQSSANATAIIGRFSFSFEPAEPTALSGNWPYQWLFGGSGSHLLKLSIEDGPRDFCPLELYILSLNWTGYQWRVLWRYRLYTWGWWKRWIIPSFFSLFFPFFSFFSLDLLKSFFFFSEIFCFSFILSWVLSALFVC